MENINHSRYAIFTKLICIGKSMRTHCHKAIEEDGFSLNETDVLLSLASGNSTVKEISLWSSITKGNASTAIDSLKRKGLVSTKVSESDRRSVRVTLEEKATSVLERLKAAEEEFFSNFMVELPSDDVRFADKIFALMQKISLPSFLERITKKEDKHEKIKTRLHKNQKS